MFLKPERLFFVSVLYNWTRIVGFLSSGELRAVLAIIRVDFWILTHLRRIVIERRQIQRRVGDALLVRHGLSLAERTTWEIRTSGVLALNTESGLSRLRRGFGVLDVSIDHFFARSESSRLTALEVERLLTEASDQTHAVGDKHY